MWSPRMLPREALLWRQQDAERQALAEGIEALFRQRKATLRYLRRCEDSSALLALQRALTPGPALPRGDSLASGSVRWDLAARLIASAWGPPRRDSVNADRACAAVKKKK